MKIDKKWVENFEWIRDRVSRGTSNKLPLSHIVKAAKVEANPHVWWTIPLLQRYRSRRLSPLAVVALACAEDLINGFYGVQGPIPLSISFPLLYTVRPTRQDGVMEQLDCVKYLASAYKKEFHRLHDIFDADGSSPPMFTNIEHVNTYSEFRKLRSLVADLEHLIYGDEMPKQQDTHRPTKVAKVGDNMPKHNGPAFSTKDCILSILQIFRELEAQHIAWRNITFPEYAAIPRTDNEAVSDTITLTPKDGETLTTDQVLQLLDHRKTGPLKDEGFVVWLGKSDDLQTDGHQFFWMRKKNKIARKNGPRSHGKRAEDRMRVRVLKAQLAGSSSGNESGKGLVADTSAKDETMVETETERVELKDLRELIKRDFLRWVTPASASASQSQDKGSISASKEPVQPSKEASASQSQDKGKKKDDATSKVPENPIPKPYRHIGDAFAAVQAELKGSKENQLGTEELRIACSSPPKEEAGEGSSALAGPSRTQSERPVFEDQDVWCVIDRLRSLAQVDGIGEALRFERGLQKWEKGDPDLVITVATVLAASRMEPGFTVSPELMVAARKRELAAARKIAAAGGAADEDVVGDAGDDHVGAEGVGPDSVGGPPVADTDTSPGGRVNPASSTAGSSGNPANSENIASLRGGGLDEPDFWNALEEDS